MNTLQGSLQLHLQRKLPHLDNVYSGHIAEEKTEEIL